MLWIVLAGFATLAALGLAGPGENYHRQDPGDP